jgi:chloramphenicol O-acetyltransferase
MNAWLERYRLRPLAAEERQGWLDWSLDFFTDRRHLQVPYLDITLALDLTSAWRRHGQHPLNRDQRGSDQQGDGSRPGASFFAWLSWSLLQTLARHPGFLLRQLDGAWWVVENPPLVVPVAVGGRQRFVELVLPDVIGSSWESFAARYAAQLAHLRGGALQRADWTAYNLGIFFGNLPHLAFTSLTLHTHGGDAPGRCTFYAGQRHWQGERLIMPLAVKLHHATSDPWLLDQLLADWRQTFLDPPARLDGSAIG